MSLHDVDKNGADRGIPKPNHSDMVAEGAHKANSTTSINPVTDSTPTSAFTKTANGQLLVNDGTTNRVSVGALADGTFGLKVSKPTKDVNTAGSSDLIFSSNQNVFKVASVISQSFSHTSGGINPSTSTVTVSHNLGYIPLALCTVNITRNDIVSANTGVYTLPYLQLGTGGGTTNVFIALAYIQLARSNTSTLTFNIGAQAPSLTIEGTIIVYVLQETAN